LTMGNQPCIRAMRWVRKRSFARGVKDKISSSLEGIVR
jgi:hypothetical protein